MTMEREKVTITLYHNVKTTKVTKTSLTCEICLQPLRGLSTL